MFMRKAFFVLPALFYSFILFAQTNPTPQTIPYTQTFSTWPSNSTTYPDGWQGWRIANSLPSGPTNFPTNAPIADTILKIGSSSSTAASIYNYNGKIGFLTTSNFDGSIVLALNSASKSNVQVSYDIMTIRNPYDTTASNRINEVTLQYRIGTSGSFTNLTGIEYQNNIITQTIPGITTPQNLQSKTITLPSSCDNKPVVQIRWISKQLSGNGLRPSFAVNNVSVYENTSLPTIISLSPANGATNVSTCFTAIITFNKNVVKGSGKIYVKKISDNGIVQTIDVPSSAVSVNNNQASFDVTNLAYSTAYYIEMDAGTFADQNGNNFNGISGNSTWSFNTASTPPNGIIGNLYDFNSCTGALPNGFTQFNATGAEIWGCTDHGHNASDSSGLTDAKYAVQMNGFNGSAYTNEDWFISPKFNLTGTNFPLLSFWSRNKFSGNQLKLKVSTNYNGKCDPRIATWTEIEGKFPPENLDVWTLSDSINLSPFKSANTYIAWVYTSTTTAAARWTLDDIKVFNSNVAPRPYILVNPSSWNFNYVASGNNSNWKEFSFTGSDFTGNVILTASPNFVITKDNATSGSSITYMAAEVNNQTNTFYVRFSPLGNNNVFSGNINVSSTAYNQNKVDLFGNSLPMSATLNIVNWNINWFGSTANGQGPSDKNLQETNVKTVLRNLNADLYAFSEIVDTMRFRRIVDSLGSDYSFKIADYGSMAPDSLSPNWLGAQKNGFIYKKSIFSNITTRGMLRYHNSQQQTDSTSYNWASGRFPYLLNATMTLNGITRNMNFIVIHSKANTGTTNDQIEAYRHRKLGAVELKDTLDNNFNTGNMILLGDFNDDLNRTIAPTTGADTVSSYQAFVIDSIGISGYKSITLPLSFAGQHSTVNHPHVIDHVIISNRLSPNYVSNSAAIRTDVVNFVSNYGTTTSDHYPVFTRYLFEAALPLPLTLLNFNGIKQGNSGKLYWSTTQEINTKEFIVERSANGISFETIGHINAAGNSSIRKNYELTDVRPHNGVNFYRLKMIDLDGRFTYSSIVKLVFSLEGAIGIRPNPAKDFVGIVTKGFNGKTVIIQVYDVNGKLMMQQANNLSNDQPIYLSLNNFSKGVYILKMTTETMTKSEKLIID
jgi:hypothetical protein